MMTQSKCTLAYFLFSFAFFSVTVNALQPLEFAPAYQNILSNTFEIKAGDADIIAKEADRWQAGAYQNPALSINLSSLGQKQGDDENQLFIGVTQIIELGGKRKAKLRVAGAGQCASEWNLETLKNNLYIKLLHSFINLAAAQERAVIAMGQQEIAEQTLKTIIAKTTSGKTSGIDEKKAQVAFKNAKLQSLKEQAHLQKAKKQLTALWDCNPPSFETVLFPLHRLLPPPPLEILLSTLKCNPELIRSEAESALASELVHLERSKRIPDIAIQVGVSTEKFVEEPALTVGFGIPLPLFDRNEGNISRASYEHLQAIYKQMDLAKQMENTLAILHQEWLWAYEQALFLKTSILPTAEESFNLAQESYKEGKLDYLNLLEARNALFDVQQQYVDAVEEYHHKRTEVFKLTATFPLDGI